MTPPLAELIDDYHLLMEMANDERDDGRKYKVF
jgi:hypothetical protein